MTTTMTRPNPILVPGLLPAFLMSHAEIPLPPPLNFSVYNIKILGGAWDEAR